MEQETGHPRTFNRRDYHNLKTPIMSLAAGMKALKDLVDEYGSP